MEDQRIELKNLKNKEKKEGENLVKGLIWLHFGCWQQERREKMSGPNRLDALLIAFVCGMGTMALSGDKSYA